MHSPFEFGIIHAFAQYMQEVKLSILHSPSGTDAKIAQFSVLVCGIPTLKNQLKRGRQISGSVVLEPGLFYQAPAERSGRLLILTSKVVFTLGFAQMLE